jgi:SAM-dependent methyltransferase
MNIIFPSECKKYINLQCNGDISLYTDFPEHKYLLKHFEGRKKPEVIVDIGSGIGRASVWLKKKMKWKAATFILVDGNSGENQYDEIRKKRGEYYNNWEMAEKFCHDNGIKYVVMCDPEKIKGIHCKFDLVYSFLAVGFHWPLDFYLNDIADMCNKGCLLAFGLRGIEKKKWIKKQIEAIDQTKYKIVFLTLRPKSTYESLLVLERK